MILNVIVLCEEDAKLIVGVLDEWLSNRPITGPDSKRENVTMVRDSMKVKLDYTTAL